MVIYNIIVPALLIAFSPMFAPFHIHAAEDADVFTFTLKPLNSMEEGIANRRTYSRLVEALEARLIQHEGNEVQFDSPLYSALGHIELMRVDTPSIRRFLVKHLESRLVGIPEGILLGGRDLYPVAKAMGEMRPSLSFVLQSLRMEEKPLKRHLLTWVLILITSEDDAKEIILHSKALVRWGGDEEVRNRMAEEVDCVIKHGPAGHPIEAPVANE